MLHHEIRLKFSKISYLLPEIVISGLAKIEIKKYNDEWKEKVVAQVNNFDPIRRQKVNSTHFTNI